VSSYVKRNLKNESKFDYLEWIYIPFIDFPLIVRVNVKKEFESELDSIEIDCRKYLKKGMLVVIRPSDPLRAKKLESILSKKNDELTLTHSTTPLRLKKVLDQIGKEASKWLMKKKIQYLCIYEIMFEDDNTPVYCLIAPESGANNEKLLKIENREVALLSKKRINDLFNLIHYTNIARKKNKSVINYLKTLK
jgi:hypothetical protein